MKRSKAIGLIGAVALGAAALAAPALAVEFDDWDVDGDRAVSPQEFQLGMGTLGLYQRWDSDHDGMLSDEEFRARPPTVIEERDAGFWDAWGLGDEVVEDEDLEADGDGTAGDRRRVFEETVTRRAIAAYDRDGDGALDEREWRAFIRDAAERGWVPQ